MQRVFSQIFETASEIFFPLACVNCRRRGANFCSVCILKLTIVQINSCPNCNKITDSSKVCSKCRKEIQLNGLIRAVRPADEIRTAVYSLKYRGVKDLRIELGAIMSHAVRKFYSSGGKQFDLIVPVPISKKRLSHRGYNQSELLAKELSASLDARCGNILTKAKNSHAQVGLSREQRLKNIKGSISTRSNPVSTRLDLVNKNILLVDDVATTLSTLNECAKVLKQAGAKSVWGVVLYKD